MICVEVITYNFVSIICSWKTYFWGSEQGKKKKFHVIYLQMFIVALDAKLFFKVVDKLMIKKKKENRLNIRI